MCHAQKIMKLEYPGKTNVANCCKSAATHIYFLCIPYNSAHGEKLCSLLSINMEKSNIGFVFLVNYSHPKPVQLLLDSCLHKKKCKANTLWKECC